ncbi:hypothetical protein [Emticicia aquatilis]|nr:hypothetical protein [Emticicia aquatilis]
MLLRIKLMFCVVFIWGNLFAQDKILKKSNDTLVTKILSIDAQKVQFYSFDDVNKSSKEVLLKDIYKIIWRNGKEYIIDEAFNKQKIIEQPVLTKSEPINVNSEKKEINEKVVLNQKLEQLKYKHFIFLFFYADNKRVNARKINRILKQNDYQTHRYFSEALKERKKGRIIQWVGATLGIFTLLNAGELYQYIGWGIAGYGTILQWQANAEFKNVINLYEEKRLSGQLSIQKLPQR